MEQFETDDVIHSHGFAKGNDGVVPSVRKGAALEELDRMLGKDKRNKKANRESWGNSKVVQENMRNPHIRARSYDAGDAPSGGAIPPATNPIAGGRSYNPYG